MTDSDVIRPQPLGTFPLPLGYLLIPAAPETEDARLALLAGRLPEWPAALRAHELALAGDRDGALAQLTGDDPVTRYNRFVMDPDREDPAELRSALGEFGVLVDVVLFALGRSETAPELGDATGEIAAVVLSTQASQALDEDDPARAVQLLDRAADVAAEASAPLRGVLLGAAGSVIAPADPGEAVSRFEQGLKALEEADELRLARAEMHLTLAGLLHEQAITVPGLINRAVPHYHSALQLVLREEAPLLWAAAHADLATAYLTMPMTEASSQLRLGVAAQSLRSALKVYTREDYPERWGLVGGLVVQCHELLQLWRRQAGHVADAVPQPQQPLDQAQALDVPVRVQPIAAARALGLERAIAPLPHAQGVGRDPRQPGHGSDAMARGFGVGSHGSSESARTVSATPG